MTDPVRPLARLRDIEQRYRFDSLATAPQAAETHAVREPIASPEDWMRPCDTAAGNAKRSSKKAA